MSKGTAHLTTCTNHPIKLLLLILIPPLVGCKYVVEPSKNTSITIRFYLADSTGRKESNFEVGQNIYFHYSISNNTGRTQNYSIAHSGPFVSFEVLQEDSLIGTSDDGLFYSPVLINRKLADGDTLKWVYSWFGSEYHSTLPSATYNARAKPNLYLYDISPSSYPKVLDFVISP